MDKLVRELTSLNQSLRRIADFLSPAPDATIFDRFVAFRALSLNSRLSLKGITEPDPVRFQELRGIDHVVSRLKGNTLQFLRGLPANNVLVHGPRGTGKSSAIKALLNEYREEGLRMIETERDALFDLPEVSELIRKRRERFIIFCDDLSFEQEESSFRQLKAVLEGSLEAKPANMLIYATSNRRHLMPETVRDNLPVAAADELHPAETLEEKVSLSDRFGLRLGTLSFDRDTYLDIVRNYAVLRDISLGDGKLSEDALRWSLSHGSYSGRTARQFVDDLEGSLKARTSKGRKSYE